MHNVCSTEIFEYIISITLSVLCLMLNIGFFKLTFKEYTQSCSKHYILINFIFNFIVLYAYQKFSCNNSLIQHIIFYQLFVVSNILAFSDFHTRYITDIVLCLPLICIFAYHIFVDKTQSALMIHTAYTFVVCNMLFLIHYILGKFLKGTSFGYGDALYMTYLSICYDWQYLILALNCTAYALVVSYIFSCIKEKKMQLQYEVALIPYLSVFSLILAALHIFTFEDAKIFYTQLIQ